MSRGRPEREKKARRTAALVLGARYELRPGYTAVPHYSADYAPCGCVTHTWCSVPCTSVGWYVEASLGDRGRYQLRCLNCDTEWSRDVPRTARRGQLTLSPEDRAARRAGTLSGTSR